MSETHDEVHWNGRLNCIPIHPQVAQTRDVILVTHIDGHDRIWAELCAIDASDIIVVEIQLLQLGIKNGNTVEFIVGKVKIQQSGDVKNPLGHPFVGQLIVIKPDEGQVWELFEIIFGNVLNVIPIQEQLVDIMWHVLRHLSQNVVCQVQLNQVLEALEDVFAQVAVAQLVMVKVKHGQVLQLIERSGRDLGDLVPAQTKLLQVGRQEIGHLLEIVLVHVQEEKVLQLLKDLAVHLLDPVVVHVNPFQPGSILEGFFCHLVYVVVLEVEIVDPGWDDGDLPQVASVTVEGAGEIRRTVTLLGAVFKDGRRTQNGRREVSRLLRLWLWCWSPLWWGWSRRFSSLTTHHSNQKKAEKEEIS